MHVAIFTRQIGHYHDARFRGAAIALGDITVVSVVNEGNFPEFLARDFGSYRVERIFQDRQTYERARVGRHLNKVITEKLDQVSPDVVAVAGWASPETFAAIQWAHRNKRGIVMMSESQSFDAARSALRETIKSRVVRACQAALVGGPSHRDYIVKLGMPFNRVHLGYNVIGNDHFAAGASIAREDPLSHKTANGLPERYILASARFIEKKNLLSLILAYSKARLEIADPPDLVILGDGPMRPDLVSMIQRENLQRNIHLPGFRSYEVLPAYYGLAECFVHFSLIEQWGLVINEAMACAIPVLVSNKCGAARALVEDRMNGFLVDPEDITSMTRAIVALLEMTTADRVRMANAASATISRWGPERFGVGLKCAAVTACAHAGENRLTFSDTLLLRWLEGRLVDRVN